MNFSELGKFVNELSDRILPDILRYIYTLILDKAKSASGKRFKKEQLNYEKSIANLTKKRYINWEKLNPMLGHPQHDSILAHIEQDEVTRSAEVALVLQSCSEKLTVSALTHSELTLRNISTLESSPRI